MKPLLALLSFLWIDASVAFIAPKSSFRKTTISHATKKTSGQGFGKSTSSPKIDDEASATFVTTADEPDDALSSSRGLQSIINDNNAPSSDLDGLTPEERSKSILRQKFGLKSYEEQLAMEGDERALVAQKAKEAQRDKVRNIEKLWPEDKDVFEVLPPELLRGVDTALKVGLGVCTLAFLVAGVFITIEAGSKATGNALPSGLDDFIVTVVEPNFTPLLGVLLGFSVSLGLFSAGQLGSKSSVYREEP